MRPKRLLLIILLGAISQGYAQGIHLQGAITDARTGNPLAGATVSVSAKNFFYTADETGKFDFTDNRVTAVDTISISCVGYITQKLAVPRASIPATIMLAPYITALSEVKIGYKKPEIIKTGSPEKTNNSNVSIMPGMQQAVFMDGSAGVNGTIQTVGFFICDGGWLLKKPAATLPHLSE